MSSPFLLSLHLLYYYLPLFAHASASGTLALFLDDWCNQASIINPTVDLAADVCLVTNGAAGVAVEELPPCASGEATLQLYQDTSCANQAGTYDFMASDNCYIDAAAVLFACTAVAKGARATATSTVSAGSSSMAVAGGAAAIPTGGFPGDSTSQSTPSTNEAAATSTTLPNPTSTDSVPTDHTRGSTTGAADPGGLSKGSQIGLGVGLPAGSIVVALLAWLCPCTRKVIRRHRPGVNSRRANAIGSSLGHQAEKGYEMWNSTQRLATPTPPAYSQQGFGGSSTQGFPTSPVNSNTQQGFGGNSTQGLATPPAVNSNTQQGFGGNSTQGFPPTPPVNSANAQPNFGGNPIGNTQTQGTLPSW